MLVDRWHELVVPTDLTAFQSGGSWLVTNPALAGWLRVDDDEYRTLGRLVAARASGGAPAALTFGVSDSAARLRLEKTLARFVLNWIVYLPEHVPEIPAPAPQLRTTYYAITEGCNLRCPYCYAAALGPRANELSTAEAIDLIDQVADMGAQEFIFTGGEPTLRFDLFQVAARSRERGMRTNIITNGTRVKTAAFARRVAEHFDIVTVSVDGGSAAVHERTRGRGTFRVLERALALLNQAGVQPKINHVVGANNVAHLDETMTFLGRYQTREVRVLNHAPLGRGLEDGQDLDWENYLQVHTFACGPGARRLIADGPRLPKPCSIRGNCGLGGTEIYVNSVGDVYPCKLLTNPAQRAGNLRDAALSELFQAPVLAGLRATSVRSFAGCETCYVRGVCGGGCRAYHAGYSGDLTINSERFCRTLRHMTISQLWIASGLDPAALRDRNASAYAPVRVGHPVVEPRVPDLPTIDPQDAALWS